MILFFSKEFIYILNTIKVYCNIDILEMAMLMLNMNFIYNS
jgi:hypothetical protein